MRLPASAPSSFMSSCASGASFALYGRDEPFRLAGSAERVVPSLLKKMPDGSEEELDDGALIRLSPLLAIDLKSESARDCLLCAAAGG
jgi:hypothetical protein